MVNSTKLNFVQYHMENFLTGISYNICLSIWSTTFLLLSLIHTIIQLFMKPFIFASYPSTFLQLE